MASILEILLYRDETPNIELYVQFRVPIGFEEYDIWHNLKSHCTYQLFEGLWQLIDQENCTQWCCLIPDIQRSRNRYNNQSVTMKPISPSKGDVYYSEFKRIWYVWDGKIWTEIDDGT